jgi:hypothetical protein
MAISITTLSIESHCAEFHILIVMLSVIMLNVIYAECQISSWHAVTKLLTKKEERLIKIIMSLPRSEKLTYKVRSS